MTMVVVACCFASTGCATAVAADLEDHVEERKVRNKEQGKGDGEWRMEGRYRLS